MQMTWHRGGQSKEMLTGPLVQCTHVLFSGIDIILYIVISIGIYTGRIRSTHGT